MAVSSRFLRSKLFERRSKDSLKAPQTASLGPLFLTTSSRKQTMPWMLLRSPLDVKEKLAVSFTEIPSQKSRSECYLNDNNLIQPTQNVPLSCFVLRGFIPPSTLSKRGRENQRQMTKTMLALRRTPLGKRYYELLSNEKPPRRAKWRRRWIGRKMYEVPGSPRCPVQH